jgi:hypothetical protein
VLPSRFICQIMSLRKLAHILVVFALLFGQASASANYDSKAALDGNNAEFGITSLLTSNKDCVQDNCACSNLDCIDGITLDCVYAAGSAQCALGVFSSLICNQFPMGPGLNKSIPISYQAPIYHGISPGITPRPPKIVV